MVPSTPASPRKECEWSPCGTVQRPESMRSTAVASVVWRVTCRKRPAPVIVAASASEPAPASASAPVSASGERSSVSRSSRVRSPFTSATTSASAGAATSAAPPPSTPSFGGMLALDAGAGASDAAHEVTVRVAASSEASRRVRPVRGEGVTGSHFIDNDSQYQVEVTSSRTGCRSDTVRVRWRGDTRFPRPDAGNPAVAGASGRPRRTYCDCIGRRQRLPERPTPGVGSEHEQPHHSPRSRPVVPARPPGRVGPLSASRQLPHGRR